MENKRLIACVAALIVAVSSVFTTACSEKNEERTAVCKAEITVIETGYKVDESVVFDFRTGDCLYLGKNEICVSKFVVNGNEQSYTLDGGVISFNFDSGVNEINLSYIVSDDSENKIIEPARVVGKSDVSPFKPPVGYFADWLLTLTMPLSFVVAAPFFTTARDTDQSSITYFFNAESVLSFAAVLSKNFIVSENKSGNKSIKRYVFTENAEDDALVISAFSFFSSHFGDFSYDEFLCGETSDDNGFVCSGSSFVCSDSPEKRFDLVKSVARQWFSSKIRESDDFCSLGDFLSTYVSLIYLAERGNEEDKSFAEKRFSDCLLATKTYADARRKTEKNYRPTICRGIKNFSDKLEYTAVGVYGGVRAMMSAEASIGRKTILKILKNFLESNEKRTVDEKTFLKSFGAYPSCKRIVSELLEGNVAD